MGDGKEGLASISLSFESLSVSRSFVFRVPVTTTVVVVLSTFSECTVSVVMDAVSTGLGSNSPSVAVVLSVMLVVALLERLSLHCSSLLGSHAVSSASNDGVSIDKLDGISIELFGCGSKVGDSLVSPSVSTWGFSVMAFLDSSFRVISGELGNVSRVQMD